LLIIGEAANTAIAAVFAVLVSLNLVTAAVLLLFTFLISAFGAFTAPAWQAVTPQLVPKQDLPAAIEVNSIGFNLSRAIGPARDPHGTARRRVRGRIRHRVAVLDQCGEQSKRCGGRGCRGSPAATPPQRWAVPESDRSTDPIGRMSGWG
jgi:hypothetical protein